MELPLLDEMYNNHCQLFIEGKICLEMFIALEEEYIKRYRLFIVNLN